MLWNLVTVLYTFRRRIHAVVTIPSGETDNSFFCCTRLAVYRRAARTWIAPGTILEIDLREVEIREVAPEGGIFAMLQPQQVIHLHTLVRTIEKASKDPRVAGLVVTLDRIEATVPQLEEIREAVLAFGAAGKKTLLHANALNEVGSATILYWFASAFQEIYMPSIASLHLAGMKMQPVFLNGLITDKLGAEAYLFARREYKNAGNMFTERKFTDAHREATEAILQAFFEQITGDIAAARNFSVDFVKERMTEGPLTAKRALDLGLIQGIAHEDEFYDKILPAKFAGPQPFFKSLLTRILDPVPTPGVPRGLPLIYASHFYKRSGGSPYANGKTKIAVINILGGIHMGESKVEFDGTPTSSGADTIILAIRQAIEDKKVKAIILRVVSPGGSAIASDMIAHEVKAAKAAGKKVIASMGQYAASGGYYVSCHADKIVAGAFTLTGSIGVIAGKLNVRPTWEKIGVTFDSVQTSDSADVHDILSGYSPENRAAMNTWVDDIYDSFKSNVAEGRKMSADQVESIAKGRVWVGRKALQLGLVDVLGTFETAVQVTKAELGLKDSDTITLKTFPLQKGIIASLKPTRNTRQISRAANISIASTFASWVLPQSAISTIRSITQLCTIIGSLTLRPEVRQLLSNADLSNLPNEVSMGPACVDTSVLSFDS